MPISDETALEKTQGLDCLHIVRHQEGGSVAKLPVEDLLPGQEQAWLVEELFGRSDWIH